MWNKIIFIVLNWVHVTQSNWSGWLVSIHYDYLEPNVCFDKWLHHRKRTCNIIYQKRIRCASRNKSDAHFETVLMKPFKCVLKCILVCALRYASYAYWCASRNISRNASRMRIACVSEMRITENVSDLHQMRFKNAHHGCPILCAFENAFETHQWCALSVSSETV